MVSVVLDGHSPIASLSDGIFRIVVHWLTRFRLTACHAVPCNSRASSLLYMCLIIIPDDSSPISYVVFEVQVHL